MARGRSIAAAQTVPVRGEVETNLESHVRIARAAADEGARVVVFPELSLTGYELDLASRLAFTGNDRRLRPLVETASSRSITVIVGAPARIGQELYIGAFIIAPSVPIEVYTKHHLGAFSPKDGADGIVPPPEKSVFAAGDRNPLVRFGDDVAAVAVCADTGHPSHAEKARSLGATTYLASMFVIPSALESDVKTLRGYAERHSMAVVFSNYGGPSGGLPAAGKSAIWSERGVLLAELDATGSGIVVAVETGTGWSATELTLK